MGGRAWSNSLDQKGSYLFLQNVFNFNLGHERQVKVAKVISSQGESEFPSKQGYREGSKMKTTGSLRVFPGTWRQLADRFTLVFLRRDPLFLIIISVL